MLVVDHQQKQIRSVGRAIKAKFNLDEETPMQTKNEKIYHYQEPTVGKRPWITINTKSYEELF